MNLLKLGAVELGFSVGVGASADVAFSSESSTTKGYSITTTGQVKGEVEVGVRAGEAGSVAANAELSAEGGRDAGRVVNERTAVASTTVGNRHISTDGSSKPPNKISVGATATVSAKTKTGANVSLRSIGAAAQNAADGAKKIWRKLWD